MKMIIKIDSKRIEIPNVRKVSELGKIRGLMFRRKEKSNALLFEFKKPSKMKIHSFFVFFDFIALWLDKDNNILEKRVVKPWTASVSPSVKYLKLLEVPLNVFYHSKIKEIFPNFPSGKRFK